MAEQNEAQEKSHDPTPTRLRQARKDGDIAISAEAHVLLIYLFMMIAIAMIGPEIVQSFGGRAQNALRSPDDLGDLIFRHGGRGRLGQIFLYISAPALVLLAVPLFAVIISAIAQNAFVLAPKRLKINLSRLSPLANAKKKYGPQGVFEFVKTGTKLTLVLLLSGILISLHSDKAIRLAALEPEQGYAFAGQWALSVLAIFTLSALIVTAIDLPMQHAQQSKKLRMSQHDLKEEAKKTEGDPHLKQERRRRAEEFANAASLKDIPGADVVIVNPTHYAVVLKWARTRNSAPVCVSKGLDHMAARIREIATENGVPIRHDPPTARAIYGTVDIGEEIKAEHYAAVAAGLRFADEIRRKARERNG